jgi:two-component system, OmpR family, sensor histidine kinase ChvG
MTAEGRNVAVEAAQPVGGLELHGLARRGWRRLRTFIASLSFHSRFTTITRRILALNMASMLVLVAGMLYLSDFRDRLIAARGDSLKIEAEIMAKALTLEPPAAGGADDDILVARPDDNISLERISDLLITLVKPGQSHGYVYKADGTWVMDSNRMYKGGRLTQFQNTSKRTDEVGWDYKLWLRFERLVRGESLPKLTNISTQNGKNFVEVKAALEEGSDTPIVRENELGETILNYAAPIEKGGKVVGALLLSTDDGAIDRLIADERLQVFRVLLLILIVTAVLSFLLASTVANPMRRLAMAAEQARKDVKARADLPDFSHRSDEIGYLARAFREMTSALYNRLDAIESFAADVAHELKNPLTSLLSAVDTLPLVRKDEDRIRLMQIIRHDVQRLNRLITDISNASRLDAELQRQIRRPVNIVTLLEAVSTAQNEMPRDRAVKISLDVKGMPRGPSAAVFKSAFKIYGDDARLSQVFVNLIDNAVSFSPENGAIRIICSIEQKEREIQILVEDDGPGIPPENLERIFERFYTDRPEQDGFGNNSGLGLNISRQIINAHNGHIWAENRLDTRKIGSPEPPRVLGARFVTRLPMTSREH